MKRLFATLATLFTIVQSVQAAPPVPPAAYTEPVTGMEFVSIPSGCFQMGDIWGDGQGDEKPVHEVCLASFMMGRYEVTNAQYRKFKPDHNSSSYDGNTLNDDNQPVVNVSWHDAAAYAQWLSKMSGKNVRLPTEAEWEYAARGGTRLRNYWGDKPSDSCVYANGADLAAKNQWPDWASTNCQDSYKVAAPVGSFLPNAYGLYDIMGNAWEWTSDWYSSEYYYSSPRQNPQGPATGTLKNPRGGGWGNASECIRASDRNGFPPDFRILFLGLRLVF
jgi:formylglycine-generating enzyme required for sulfatase activity